MVNKRGRPSYTDEILPLIAMGMRVDEIVAKVGCSPGTARDYIRRHRGPLRITVPRTAPVRRDVDVALIAQLAAEGANTAMIMEQTGCGSTTANRYIRMAHPSRPLLPPTKLKISQAKYFQYLLEHPCIDCGEGDPVVLEPDHVRGTKTANVSVIMATSSWEAVKAELAKCDIRCSNCHRLVTAIRQRSYRARLAGYCD